MPSTITANPTGVVSPNVNPPSLTSTSQATVAAGGDPLASAVVSTALQVSMNDIAYLKSRLLSQHYGDGSDGTVACDGTSSPPCLNKAGSVYSMYRDIYATSVAVSASATLQTNGFAIYATVSVSVSGIVDASGASASVSSGGVSDGPHATSGANGAATNATTISQPQNLAGLGGTGSAGGVGSTSVAGNGVGLSAASILTYRIAPFRYGQIQQSFVFGTTTGPTTLALDYLRGGGAGGAGGGDGTNAGGGGGAGGALMVIIASTIAITGGSLLSDGGHGGTPAAGNCGGGSGGSGGAFLFVCSNYTNSGGAGAFTAAAGIAGGKSGTGAQMPGNAGNPGNATPYIVTIS